MLQRHDDDALRKKLSFPPQLRFGRCLPTSNLNANRKIVGILVHGRCSQCETDPKIGHAMSDTGSRLSFTGILLPVPIRLMQTMKTELLANQLPRRKALLRWNAIDARLISPRIPGFADTYAAGRLAKCHQPSNLNICKRAKSVLGSLQDTSNRLCAAPPADPAAQRIRRLQNGNAHVDRCAPPGRNAGGGAYWKPD